MSMTPRIAPVSGSWIGTAVQLHGCASWLKCSPRWIWMPWSRASAVPGALVPTRRSDQSDPSTNSIPSAFRRTTRSPSIQSRRPSSSPMATIRPEAKACRISRLCTTGRTAASGCRSRSSRSSSALSSRSGAGFDGSRRRVSDRSQDSCTSRRTPERTIRSVSAASCACSSFMNSSGPSSPVGSTVHGLVTRTSDRLGQGRPRSIRRSFVILDTRDRMLAQPAQQPPVRNRSPGRRRTGAKRPVLRARSACRCRRAR